MVSGPAAGHAEPWRRACRSRRVGGAATCVEHSKNGFIVETECAPELADAISCLQSDSSQRREFVARSLAKLSSFSADRMIDETLAVYEAAVTTQAGCR
jgi:glycosyltransferase involved in cell wall biosynthesis